MDEGCVLLVGAAGARLHSRGYQFNGLGSATKRSDVLWVGSEYSPAGTGIYGVASAADVKRWNRHYRRQWKNAQRSAATP